jgi:trimethylamine--corrinoid protein Co-methyltransferase
MTGSLQMLTLMDEAIGMVRHIAKGVTVNEDTLAEATVAEVGAAGNYLSAEHTLRHFRSELWFPKLMNRQRLHDWERQGRTTMTDRAQARLEHILETHQPTPVSDETHKAIERVLGLAEAREKYS